MVISKEINKIFILEYGRNKSIILNYDTKKINKLIFVENYKNRR